jgi:molybdate transport system substrate-binding protein
VRSLLLGLCLLLGLPLASVGEAAAANVKFITTAAFRSIALDVIPAFEKQSGHKVTLSIDTTGGIMQRIRTGEAFDVVVTTQEAVDQLVDLAKLAGDSTVPLVRVGIGVAVGLGAPQPNIFSVEGFRQTLLASRRIAYADPTTGAIGAKSITAIIQTLGITSQISKRTLLVRSGLAAELVARGEADIALQLASELKLVPSVRFAGLVPAQIQVYTTYAGGISSQTREQEASIALMSALADPGMEPLLKRRGMEMP